MKKANPLAIGIFVITATFLLVAGVIILGAGKFFQKTRDYICYFDESVNGLDVGAPVKYKGVTLGKVNKIYISNDASIRNQQVMVIFSLVENNDISQSLADDSGVDMGERIKSAINEGLRAKLEYQSYVTGMLYIELDYYAKENDKINYKYNGTSYDEMPTVASNEMQAFKEKFSNIADDIANMQLDEIGQNLNKTLITLNAKLEAIDTKAINDKTLALVDDISMILNDDSIKGAMSKIPSLLDNVDALVVETTKNINKITDKVDETMSKGNSFLDNINAFTSSYSPFMTEFSQLLNTLKTTSQSAQSLMEYLERNPSALLKGKPVNSTEK